MTPQEANDITVAVIQSELDANPPPAPHVVRVIRLPRKPPALSPEEAERRRITDALEQAERRREELTVLATFERLWPGRPLPAHYQGAAL